MSANVSEVADTQQNPGGYFGKLRDVAHAQAKERALDDATRQDNAQVRHRLSALKALSPLALAVVQRPGFDAADGELLAAIKQLRDETERASRELVALIGAENEPLWMVKSISATVAEFVAAEWVSGVATLDMSPYQPIWGFLADAEFADFEAEMPKDPDLDADVMLRLSMIKAMSQVVVVTRRSYMMRHDPDKLYPTIANLLVKTASGNLDRIVSSESSENTRLMALQSLIGKAADVFCSHWDVVVRPTVDYLLALEKDERIKLYREYPEGLPLDKIVQGFSADLARIVGGVASFDFKPNPVSGEIKNGE